MRTVHYPPSAVVEGVSKRLPRLPITEEPVAATLSAIGFDWLTDEDWDALQSAVRGDKPALQAVKGARTAWLQGEIPPMDAQTPVVAPWAVVDSDLRRRLSGSKVGQVPAIQNYILALFLAPFGPAAPEAADLAYRQKLLREFNDFLKEHPEFDELPSFADRVRLALRAFPDKTKAPGYTPKAGEWQRVAELRNRYSDTYDRLKVSYPPGSYDFSVILPSAQERGHDDYLLLADVLSAYLSPLYTAWMVQAYKEFGKEIKEEITEWSGMGKRVRSVAAAYGLIWGILFAVSSTYDENDPALRQAKEHSQREYEDFVGRYFKFLSQRVREGAPIPAKDGPFPQPQDGRILPGGQTWCAFYESPGGDLYVGSLFVQVFRATERRGGALIALFRPLVSERMSLITAQDVSRWAGVAGSTDEPANPNDLLKHAEWSHPGQGKVVLLSHFGPYRYTVSGYLAPEWTIPLPLTPDVLDYLDRYQKEDLSSLLLDKGYKEVKVEAKRRTPGTFGALGREVKWFVPFSEK